MRSPLRYIEERPLVITIILSASGFLLGLFGETVFEQWATEKITGSSAGILIMIAALLLVLLTLSSAAIDLMLKLNRKVGIKVRYYERDRSGEVYIRCQKVVARAKKRIDVLNSYMVEGHDSLGSPREKVERQKYYATLMERVTRGDVKYRRIVQVRKDRSNLTEMKDDEVHEAHLRAMIDQARGPHAERISLLECPPSRVTTFVLVDGENLIWQINEVQTDAAGVERLSLQGAFIFHDPQSRITEHFARYFERLLMNNNGPLRFEPASPSKSRPKRPVVHRSYDPTRRNSDKQ
jgi:hypothetical protein